MSRTSISLVVVVVAAVAGVQLTACGGPRCIEGTAQACACSDGRSGAQTCSADGIFGECTCTGGTTDGGSGGGGGSATGGGGGGGGGSTTGDAGQGDAGVDAGTDAGLTRTYVAMVLDASSVWSQLPTAMGATGLVAGTNACRFVGADHPCEYQELIQAAAKGEFASIVPGTTAWLQRTTVAMQNNQTLQASPGANCNDWTFNGNHLADGEYVVFGDGGVPTFHFDPDPTYDPAQPNVFVTPGDLDCGGATRNILCCAP